MWSDHFLHLCRIKCAILLLWKLLPETEDASVVMKFDFVVIRLNFITVKKWRRVIFMIHVPFVLFMFVSGLNAALKKKIKIETWLCRYDDELSGKIKCPVVCMRSIQIATYLSLCSRFIFDFRNSIIIFLFFTRWMACSTGMGWMLMRTMHTLSNNRTRAFSFRHYRTDVHC